MQPPGQAHDTAQPIDIGNRERAGCCGLIESSKLKTKLLESPPPEGQAQPAGQRQHEGIAVKLIGEAVIDFARSP